MRMRARMWNMGIRLHSRNIIAGVLSNYLVMFYVSKPFHMFVYMGQYSESENPELGFTTFMKLKSNISKIRIHDNFKVIYQMTINILNIDHSNCSTIELNKIAIKKRITVRLQAHLRKTQQPHIENHNNPNALAYSKNAFSHEYECILVEPYYDSRVQYICSTHVTLNHNMHNTHCWLCACVWMPAHHDHSQ